MTGGRSGQTYGSSIITCQVGAVILWLDGQATNLKHRITAMDTYRVTLTTAERAELEQLVSCGKAAARKLVHARVLLLTDDSCGDERDDQIVVRAQGSGRGPSRASADNWSPTASTPPCVADANPLGRTRSRSRGTSSSG